MNDKVTHFTDFPRAIRPAPDPLGLYLCPGHNGHSVMLDTLASGNTGCFGGVFDPTKLKLQAELKDQALKRKLDVILDPKTLQSATPGGFTDALGKLPWGIGRPHLRSDFEGTSGRRLISELADFACGEGFTQVISPSHLLNSVNDHWLRLDTESTIRLRESLDRKGCTDMPIIYQLAMPYSILRDRAQRGQIIKSLRLVPGAAIWLKIDGFGSDSSATAVRNYIEAATEFHQLGVPVIADHVGGIVGLALLAFGAVGGISHGITLSERFNARSWKQVRSFGSFGQSRRVYVPSIDSMLKVADAKALIESSGRSRAYFACNDTNCCPRGVKDMLENPGRHFLLQRMKEVSGLSLIPETLRSQRFLDQHLRPATDKALAAANIKWDNEKMTKKMQANRKRLDQIRIALGDHAQKIRCSLFHDILLRVRFVKGVVKLIWLKTFLKGI